MMKILMMMIFMIPLCLKKYIFWMVQMLIFVMSYLFMNLTINFLLFSNLSYFYSCNLISFALILLSIWICGLMIMASENLLKMYFYYIFFI